MKHHFVADRGARRMAVDGQEHHLVARRERQVAPDKWCGEREPLLQREELAERHEVNLAIHRRGLSIGAQQERRVVLTELGLGDDLIAAEQNRHSNLARQLAKRSLTDGVVTEREWSGRLRPDHELSTTP